MVMVSIPIDGAGEGEQPLQEALREAPALPPVTAISPDSPVNDMPLNNSWTATRGADAIPSLIDT